MMVLYCIILSMLCACSPTLNPSVVCTATKDPKISALHYTFRQGLSLPKDTIIIIDEIQTLPEKALSTVTRLDYQLTQEQYSVTTKLIHKNREVCFKKWDIYQTQFESSNAIYLERFLDDYHTDKLIQKIQHWIYYCAPYETAR